MKKFLDEGLYALIEPLLPPPKRRRKHHPGRKPISNYVALKAILYVLITGIPWEYLPEEIGCVGMTAWRKLRDWQQAGVWQKIFEVLLGHLNHAGQIDWSRASVDSASVRAVGAGEKNRPQPHGSGQGRLETPSARRRRRAAPFAALVRRERQRHRGVPAAPRRRAAGAGKKRPSPASA